jgi:hypothetical protein
VRFACTNAYDWTRLALRVTLTPYLTFWLVRFRDRSEWLIALSSCIFSWKISSSSTRGADPDMCQSEEFRFVPPVIPRTSSGLSASRPPSYTGCGCGRVHREFSWTLGVTCLLLNISDLPAHMILCHLQHLSNDTVYSSLSFVLAEL